MTPSSPFTSHAAQPAAQAPQALVAVVGGSGLYQMEGLQGAQALHMDTPFGRPSDALWLGTLHGVPVVFLARHGQGHALLPSEVPYRANLYALRQLGVRYVLSLSAVGSLREHIAPMDLVLPDQYLDLTRGRASSFFGQGAVAHVSMAQPFCPATVDALRRAATAVLAQERAQPQTATAVPTVPTVPTLHSQATYVCIEGPQYTCRAESLLYRQWGGDIIGMTNLPEAKLAREAQMAYATLAMVTDVDCWQPRQAHVNAQMVLANLQRNAQRAQRIASAAIALLGAERPTSEAHTALADALVTPTQALSPAWQRQLDVLGVPTVSAGASRVSAPS